MPRSTEEDQAAHPLCADRGRPSVRRLCAPGRDPRAAHPLREERLPLLQGPLGASRSLLPWTRNLNGKTATSLLGAAQMAPIRSWFENARLVRNLTSACSTLSLDITGSVEDLG